jgi:Resolvase, N terminal domain
MKPLIGYRPVSTREQGRSGLGLEAQTAAVEAYAAARSAQIIAWYEDVQSGADRTRPGLERALAYRAYPVAELPRQFATHGPHLSFGPSELGIFGLIFTNRPPSSPRCTYLSRSKTSNAASSRCRCRTAAGPFRCISRHLILLVPCFANHCASFSAHRSSMVWVVMQDAAGFPKMPTRDSARRKHGFR